MHKKIILFLLAFLLMGLYPSLAISADKKYPDTLIAIEDEEEEISSISGQYEISWYPQLNSNEPHMRSDAIIADSGNSVILKVLSNTMPATYTSEKIDRENGEFTLTSSGTMMMMGKQTNVTTTLELKFTISGSESLRPSGQNKITADGRVYNSLTGAGMAKRITLERVSDR